MSQTLKQSFETVRTQLKNDRLPWEDPWKDIDRFIWPDQCQWSTSPAQQKPSETGFSNILDDTPVSAINTCSAGLHSGITNPSRPWFELDLPDQDIAKIPAVRAWLEECRDRMLTAFSTSNLYNALPITYGNVAAFGIDAMVMEEDDDEVFRFENLAIGTYWLGANAKREVDCIVREITMTAGQVVERFGKGKISDQIRTAYENNNCEQLFSIVHIVCRNKEYKEGGIFSYEKRYISCYYEDATSKEDTFLSKSGFDTFPVLAPRWKTTGRNVYGQGPGKQMLGNAKALQSYKRAIDKGVSKMADPPLAAPSSLRTSKVTQIPGGITYYDESKTSKPTIGTLYDVHAFQVDKVFALQQDARQRLDDASFASLFKLLMNSDRRQITAEEIRAKQEEKILQIGPVLENLNSDLLDRLISRSFTSMLNRGLLPPPPQEVQGAKLTVRYVSILAQVQKMLGLGAMDRFLGVIGNVAGIKPEITDNVDPDKVLLEYHDMLGVTNRILRPETERDAIRQGRAQMQAQQMAMAATEQQAKSAQLLSETDTRGANALTDLIAARSGAA